MGVCTECCGGLEAGHPPRGADRQAEIWRVAQDIPTSHTCAAPLSSLMPQREGLKEHGGRND